MAAKLVKTDIKAIPCDSLQAALAGYNKSLSTGGRRLESAGSTNSTEQDSHKNLCNDPEWSKRIASANLITDTDIRVIVTAAILDEAEEYVARDMVLNNSKVIPCAKN